MNHHDVNRMFTDKVSELLAQGFQIHSGTMRGSQGEIAKIDLYRGDEILRVWMSTESSFGKSYYDYLCIRVGRWTKNLRFLWDDTIWEHDLEVLSEIKLAKITDDFYTTPEESKEMGEKRLARWRAKERSERRELTSAAAKAIALKYVRRQPRMKTCKLEDIQKVVRVNKQLYGQVLPGLCGYEITARGKRFLLRPRKG